MATPSKRLIWIDQLKAIALLWIFLNHASERLFGSPYIANPAADWPPLHDRLAQLHPLMIPGLWQVPANLFRYIGWLGDQGVSLFLLLSGFGLVWGLITRPDPSPLHPAEFYRRRLNRIYPLWIAAHLCILFPLAFIAMRVSLIDSAFYFSLVGIRILPDQLYYGIPAWWFVSLILQLYLIFPLLWRWLQRWGTWPFLLVIAGGSMLIRAAGLFYFHDYLDAWNRGAVFITRLPEFSVGMALALWLHRSKSPGRLVLWIFGLVSLAIAAAASLTLAGMTFAPLLGGVGTLALLYAIFNRAQSTRGILNWIGLHSLSLYLVHQPFVDALLPQYGQPIHPTRLLAGFILAILGTTIAALVLEKITMIAIQLFDRARQRWGGWSAAAFRLTGLAAATRALLIAASLAIQHWNPQEPIDLGWGERPSLQPSEIFGWNLKPSRQTRLRWQSYDYTVTANSLGFPGPQYSDQKPPGALRILVTGDAFTSAEGVNTNQAWPRLLEDRLAESIFPRPQVLNFAITGYGPNQYLAVIQQFLPRFKPDLVLIGLFVNDYGDVLESNDEFRAEIGFGLPNPRGPAAILTFRQFAALVRNSLMKSVYQNLLHKPDPLGYLMGQFHFIQTDCPELLGDGRDLLQQRLLQIKQIAGHTPVIIVMIPAASQVAVPGSLAYWPAHVDLSNRDRFDLDLPQRTTRQIAATLSMTCYDLRPALQSAGNVYQSRNMHWTPLGHEITAKYLAAALRSDGFLKLP